MSLVTGFGFLDQTISTSANPLPRPTLPRPLFSHQPLKAIYLVLFSVDLALRRVPFWILKYSIPSLRPSPTWSLHRSLFFSILKSLFNILPSAGVSLGARDHKTLDPIVLDEKNQNQENGELKKVKGRALWVEPIMQEDLIKGQLKRWIKDTEATAERVPGYWTGKNRFQQIIRAEKDEKVILFLHGGGLVQNSAHPSDATNKAVYEVLQACQKSSSSCSVLPQRAFSLEYRLVQTTSFPGVLLDALAGYYYLLSECGFQAKNVIVMGDSAGGLLSLALARYLRDEKVLEMMGGLALLSPWLDMSLSYASTLNASNITNKSTDYLTDSAVLSGVKHILCGMPRDAVHSPYLSPIALGSSIEPDLFEGFPKAIIFAGGLERSRDQIRDVARYYGDDKSVYFEEKDATHDYMALPFNDVECKRTAKRISDWMRKM